MFNLLPPATERALMPVSYVRTYVILEVVIGLLKMCVTKSYGCLSCLAVDERRSRDCKLPNCSIFS